MNVRRRALRVVAVAVAASAACAPLSRGATWTYGTAAELAMPLASTLRLDLPHGIRAVRDRGSIVYAVPVQDGVALIDAGLDEDAVAAKRLVGDAPVRAILATHGHLDHTAGAAAFDAPLHVGAADVALVREDRCARAWFVHVVEHVVHHVPPSRVVAVDDGDTIVVGGEAFRAIALPGHTAGSTAWLWRDVLFTGDALYALDGEVLRVPPAIVSDDAARAIDSLRRLRDVDFAVLADGHYGTTTEPQEKIEALLARAKRPFDP